MLTRQRLFVTMTRMLTIRLQRVGKRNEPTYRVVLTDSQNGPKSGRFIEVLGSYDARDKNVTKVDADKVKEWISKGAQVSDTVHNLLINLGVIEGKKINVLPKKTPIAKEVEEGAETAEKTEEAAPADADAPAADVTEETDAPAETEEASAEEVKEEAPEAKAEETPAEEPAESEEKPTEEKEETPAE
jgi:small subunit ribosomal protein S16